MGSHAIPVGGTCDRILSNSREFCRTSAHPIAKLVRDFREVDNVAVRFVEIGHKNQAGDDLFLHELFGAVAMRLRIHVLPSDPHQQRYHLTC